MAIAYLLIVSGFIMSVFCGSLLGSIWFCKEITHRERLIATLVLLVFITVSALVFVQGSHLYERCKM